MVLTFFYAEVSLGVHRFGPGTLKAEFPRSRIFTSSTMKCCALINSRSLILSLCVSDYHSFPIVLEATLSMLLQRFAVLESVKFKSETRRVRLKQHLLLAERGEIKSSDKIEICMYVYLRILCSLIRSEFN